MPSIAALHPSVHTERAKTSEDLRAPTQLFSSCWTPDNREQGSNS